MGRYAGQKFLVAGLGASGVSAARYLVREGAVVHVTDADRSPRRDVDISDIIDNNKKYYGYLHTSELLNAYTAVVAAPGIALGEPLLRAALDAGVPVMGDVELFARAAAAPVIGITGSNGKSTVTTLVGEMAQAAGLRVGVGGNLGTPALDLLRDDAQLYVLELSSFQLETTHSLRCRAATMLNLSQDHLDRHLTMEAYGAAKARIWSGCELRVLNREDAAVMALSSAQPQGAATKTLSFGLDQPAPGQYGLVQRQGEPWLAHGEEPLLACRALRIYGSHNWANALAALALADAAGIPREASLRVLREFRGLPHRCEFIAEVAGVKYFNDSKGTNVGSTLAALRGLPAPIVWLAGGQGKGQDFTPLRETLAEKARAAVLFGEDADRIADDIRGAVPVERTPDMKAALAAARQLARPQDCVLLSPACASFDQFRNYMDRGEQFRTAVQRMAEST